MRNLSIVAVLLALPALAHAEDDPGRKVTYVCERGPDLVITYTDDAARIAVPDGDPIVLKQRLAADGFRYGDKASTLRGRGREVTYANGSKRPVRCRVPDDP
ncbi:MAG: MliC family protein [Acidisphaera sp.]|nr:MliC family protein [Acidisphaera sp.]MBV9812417.1 MliC family protein [Acetobacteraceae bacterium]